jgi:hypothetical protein
MQISVTNALELLLMLAIPLLVFAWIIHQIERLTQRRLAERFGWRSIMWTGWLGTPIHELSHAVMCLAFRHRIDEIALFEPDEEAGRLGYVRHSFRHGNMFEELGNLFIGIAPLIGGSIALSVLLWMFYPEAARQAIEQATNAQAIDASPLNRLFATITGLCRHVFSPEHVGSGRFFGFLYLVLCIGSHMAPSRSDYAGAKRGLMIFLGLIAIATVLLAFVLQSNPQFSIWLVAAISALLSLLALTVILCAVASAAVHVVTQLFPVRFEHV